jgi:hypothetical protein
LLLAVAVVQERVAVAPAVICQEQQVLAFRHIQVLLVLVVQAALLPLAIAVAIHLFLGLLLLAVAALERLVPQ